MVAAFARPDETSGAWTIAAPELRLDAGQEVHILLGPICIAELCWYQVVSHDPLVGWDADHDGQVGDSERGWIAAGDADGPYVELAERLPGVGPPRISASGTSSANGAPFVVDEDGVGLSARWAFATDGLAPCHLRVVLQPGNVVLVDEGLEGAFTEGSTQTVMTPPGEYHLEVSASVDGAPEARCPWAVALDPIWPGIIQ
jgi:hypothetical protein